MPNWWVLSAYNSGGPPLVFAWAAWVILSITLHELSHGWAALRRGDTTPIDTGHMTWNPIVHMGQMSLIVFALTGIAWGAMPVNPSRMRGRYADAWVSFCGPLMNFALAVGCILATVVTVAVWPMSGGVRQNPEMYQNMLMFFSIGCALNVTLGLFNLLPAPPLDGSRILADFSFQYRDFLRTQGGQFMGMIMFMLAFFFAGKLIGGVGARAWILGSGHTLELLHQIGVGPGSPWSLGP